MAEYEKKNRVRGDTMTQVFATPCGWTHVGVDNDRLWGRTDGAAFDFPLEHVRELIAAHDTDRGKEMGTPPAMRHKVTVRVEVGSDDWGEPDTAGFCTVIVDDVAIASGSVGGGCSEDNTRGRDYGWIEVALLDLASKLGADTEHVVIGEED